MEEAERRYGKGRSGYHLLTHFQCDTCHFRNMKEREPKPNSEQYERIMLKTRQDTLYAFWIREPMTVRGKFTMVIKLRGTAKEELGL